MTGLCKFEHSLKSCNCQSHVLGRPVFAFKKTHTPVTVKVLIYIQGRPAFAKKKKKKKKPTPVTVKVIIYKYRVDLHLLKKKLYLFGFMLLYRLRPQRQDGLLGTEL